MKPGFLRPEGGESIKRPTCYVCGCARCGEYPLAVRQQATGPYFPFLETHEPPDGSEPPSSDGRILSCFLCYSYLTQQWQLYERDKVPPVKRIYWLKRVDNGPYTGVEVGVQSEYASQLLGLAPDPPAQPSEVKRAGSSAGVARSQPQPPPPPPSLPPPPPPATITQPSTVVPVEVKRPRVNPPQPQPPSLPLPPPGVLPLPYGLAVPQASTQQEALDLSLDGRRGIKREREEELPPRDPRDPSIVAPRTEVLDLRMPDKNATTEVCYVCGDHYKKGTLVDIYAKQQNETSPFFPSLMLHPRPSKSHPMEASGRVQGCRDCFKHMQMQWDAYETRKIPQVERFYSLRKKASTIVDDSTAFVCYKCGREYPSSSLCLVYCRPNADKDPFYPFIEKLIPPEGASPISPQGLVQVCSSCSKVIPQQQKELIERNESNRSPVKGNVMDECTEQPGGGSPPPHAQHVSAGPLESTDVDPQLDEATCYLCHQNHSRQTMHWLAMVAESARQDGMYFSFLKYLPRIGQNSLVENGRVLACSLCYQHLSNQWTEYEKDKVLEEHRQFSLRAIPSNSMSPRLTPGPTLSSPGMSPTDGSPTHSFSTAAEAHTKSSTDVKKVTSGYMGQPLHTLEVVPAEPDPSSPTLSVITTQRALNVAVNCFVCSFHSKPGQTFTLRNKPHGSEPFFPFLAKHQSAHPEARVDDTCVLACLCCFHSLILQWQRYEKEKVAHYARLYDTYNYMCFICSLKTYRKRLYLLPVKDYPFLKEHNRPPGGMVVDNGHSVVVCKDCYSSLKNQYIELERWGVPVEKRQYNWIQRPPPPEFQHGTSAKSIQVFTSGTQPTVVEPGSSSPGSQLGNSPGAVQQPGGGGSPRGSHGPVLGSSSAVVDGAGIQVHASKQSEELALPANSALSKANASTSMCADSSETCIGNIHSCYAPLPLKIGIARQGGTQSNNLTKQHSMGSSESLISGNTKGPGNSEQKVLKVDQFSKNSNSSGVSKPGIQGHVSSNRDTVYQLENHDKLVHKKRRSVIRGLNTPAVATSSASSQIQRPSCTQQLLSTSPELQTKCS